jgi:hypothetical protein
MKRLTAILFHLAIALAACRAFAQDNPPADKDGQPGTPPLGGRPPLRHDGNGHGASFRPVPDERPLMRWLDKRREENPQEFERLQKLRNENPQEFRRQLMSRLGDERMRRVMREHPDVHKALEQVPEERRRAFFASLAESAMQPSGQEGHSFPRPGPSGVESPPSGRFDMLREMGEPIRQYKGSQNEEEKRRIREQVKDTVSGYYDRRIKERRDGLRRMEEDLAKMRREIEDQDKLRERAIEERVTFLLDGGPAQP